jgi:hypothetical protein
MIYAAAGPCRQDGRTALRLTEQSRVVPNYHRQLKLSAAGANQVGLNLQTSFEASECRYRRQLLPSRISHAGEIAHRVLRVSG